MRWKRLVGLLLFALLGCLPLLVGGCNIMPEEEPEYRVRIAPPAPPHGPATAAHASTADEHG